MQEFIEIDVTPIALEKADLNGDGKTDFLVVTERAKIEGEEFPGDERSLIILIRKSNGKLEIAVRNEQVVYCSSCGGVFGDPFAGVTVKRNSFTVNNYGGSNLRWSESYQFNYSRIDKSWQLVQVEENSYNSTDPEKTTKSKIFTPKKFGKINIADFSIDLLKR